MFCRLCIEVCMTYYNIRYYGHYRFCKEYCQHTICSFSLQVDWHKESLLPLNSYNVTLSAKYSSVISLYSAVKTDVSMQT